MLEEGGRQPACVPKVHVRDGQEGSIVPLPSPQGNRLRQQLWPRLHRHRGGLETPWADWTDHSGATEGSSTSHVAWPGHGQVHGAATPALPPAVRGSGAWEVLRFSAVRKPFQDNKRLHLRLHKTQPWTSAHDKEPRERCSCCKKERGKKKKNETAQIKFSNSSGSKLHVSHFSVIYRRP